MQATGNWMRCQEVVSVQDKNINYWTSEVKQYEETMSNEQNQNGRGEYQCDEITYTKGGLLCIFFFLFFLLFYNDIQIHI